ncbi:MAG: 2,3-bisphosphoglycerate-independent phosphoglycerate mutase [Candidatus Aminicenantales bacterium]
MEWEEIALELTFSSPTKIVLLVIDGLGGLPFPEKTELEEASTPHLDSLAANSSCGLTIPVLRGITPGSGPAHLALFGYNPLKHMLGRGILEAFGLGIEVGEKDLVARGNFATKKEELITDRRAGRISTAENEKLCSRINDFLQHKEEFRISLFPGKEHRFVLKMSGDFLSDALSDADPQKNGAPPLPVQPLSPEAAPTARLVNSFIEQVSELLKDSPQANTILLRGFSKLPEIPSMEELYKLKPAAVAHYPMYKGLARIVGMKILEPGPEISNIFDCLEEHYQEYDFFYLHVKKTDTFGEDGAFETKVKTIEAVDSYIPRLLSLKPDVLVVTSDHSTPALLKSHSWHPNPFLLHAKTAMPDRISGFTERTCGQGSLGLFPAMHAMPLMLAHALKMKKFGA